MHDLLRDMALHIAKSGFMVKAGTMLRKLPNVQEWSMELENVKNPLLYIPLEMSSPECPGFTTLLLSRCNVTSIPEGFFKHMDARKVLGLSRNRIKNLPNSLSNCSMLTTL
ncbi:hypothetical protein V6N11_030722 [Hibiscus sabdariffa]